MCDTKVKNDLALNNKTEILGSLHLQFILNTKRYIHFNLKK